MVAGAKPDHSTHVQQVKVIATFHTVRHITNKAFQSSPAAKNADEYVAGVYLGKSTRRQFQHIVCCAVSKSAHRDHIARAWSHAAVNNCYRPREAERRS